MLIAIVIVAVGNVGAWFSFQSVVDARAHDRAEQIAQLCAAIPNSAAASAQALIDIVIADAYRRHTASAQIADTRRLGVLYVRRARELALADLPACPKEP